MRLTILAGLCCALLLAGRGVAQEATGEDSYAERMQRELENTIGWNEYYVASQDAPLESQIVMRWSNQVRGGQTVYGITVVWADQLRPQVIASIFPWIGIMTKELDVLAREPNLVAKQNGGIVWQPQSTGIEFRPVPEAPEPSESEAIRRVQLKHLASQFEVTMTGFAADDSDREELRMLPQWLYRYGQPGAEVMDGALFAYVVGTDPEAALMIEAYRTAEAEYEWQYAFVRQTTGGLEGRWRDQVVWTAEKRPSEDDPSKPHFRVRRSLPVDLRVSR